MSISSLYPNVSPSLLLDFARAKTLDPRITFTRTTTATYFDSDGVLQTALPGQARFDHNPVTGDSLGLLVEEQRSNLFTYSEQFDDSAWTKTRSSITANTIIAPDGTLTADKLVEDATTGEHQVSRATAITSGVRFSFSCFVKSAERTIARLAFSTGGASIEIGTATYNLVSQAIVTSGTVFATTIQDVGNGWFKISAVTSQSTGTGSPTFSITLVSTGTTTNYTGDGTSGLYIWGAQVEAGAFATSYIPTTTTALTRNADVASMTGRNFSDWYNASEGSLYGESSSLRDTATRWPFAFDDGSATNLIGVRFTSTQVQNRVFVNSVAQADIVTAQTTGYAKTALGYQTNNFAAAVNDVLVGTDTSGTIPVVSQFTIGRVTGGSPICGHIRKLAYYPERLSNEQLRALTT